MKNILKVLILIVIIATMLFGCSSANKKDTLYIGSPMHNGLYNPLYAATVYDNDVCSLVFEGLVVTDSNGMSQINDRLVSDFKIADDNKYIFTLKDNITFSDGTPLTAEDIVFTYKTLMDPSSTAFLHQWADDFQGGKEYSEDKTNRFSAVIKSAENKVTFKFNKKSRANLEKCGIKIISKDYYPDWAKNNVDFAMHEKMHMPMGSGPYKLKEYHAGKSVVLEKNKNYWAESSTNYNINRIDIKFYNVNTIEEAIEKGEVDFADAISNSNLIDNLTESADTTGFTITPYKMNLYGLIAFNTTAPFSDDVALRQSFAYVFNRKAFVEEYFKEKGELAVLPAPVTSDLYSLAIDEANLYEYDLETAKNLLEKSGYTGVDDGLKNKDYEPVELRFLAIKDNASVNASLPYIKDAAKSLGITLEIDELTFAEVLNIVQSDSTDWNMVLMADGWNGDDPNELAPYFSSTASNLTNITGYTNPQVDGWLEVGLEQDDAYSQKASENYKKAILTLNRDLPEIPIYTKSAVYVCRGVEGLSPNTYQRWSQVIEGAYLNK